MKWRRVLSNLLAITLIITQLPITALADNYNGTGSGNQGGTSDSSVYTWSTQKQGYRITIIDQSGNVVADPVDILQSKEPSDGLFFYTSKVEGFKSRTIKPERYYLADILNSSGFDKNNPMPMAISWDNNDVAHAEGDALRQWLMAGEAAIRVENPTNSGNNHIPPTNSGTGNTNPPADNKPTEQTKQELKDKQVNDIIKAHKAELTKMKNEFVRYGYNLEEIKAGLVNYMNWQSNKLGSVGLDDNQKGKIIQSMFEHYTYLYQQAEKEYIEKWSNKNLSLFDSILNLSFFDNLKPLIAYGAEENKGYMLPLLNYDVNGEYIFKMKGEDNNKSTGKVRGEIIAKNDYIVLIEPITWFVPLDRNKNSYGKYVYGTITNHAQWAAEMNKHGWDDYGKGGQYMLVTTGTGATSLKLSEDLALDSKTIKAPTDGNKPSRQNTLVADLSIGYALHSYKAAYGESGTHTFDSNVGNIPHSAPDPSNIPLNDGENINQRTINIIKTYEDNGEHVSTHMRTRNPQSIRIQDEIDYKVDEWFSSEDFIIANESTTWTQIKNNTSSSNSGKSPTTIKVEDPNTTLYVKLVKKTPVVTTGSGDLIITESQITKSVDTLNTFGAKVMNFDYQSLSGTCSYTWSTGSGDNITWHTCGKSYVMRDSSHEFRFKNIEPIKDKLQANAGVFKALHAPYNGVSHSRGLSAGTYGVDEFNYQMVLWRGQDIPTIAGYKENSNHELNVLLGRYGKQPAGNRIADRVYFDSLSVELDKDGSIGDYYTESGHHDETKSSTATNSNTIKYSGDVTIQSYTGKRHEVGNAITTNTTGIFANLVGKSTSVKFSGGTVVSSSRPVKFYPYHRMTYQRPAALNNDRININVLSQWISELYPHSFAEAAWGSTKDLNMNITSPQWSVYQKATQGSDGWQGTNKVLPGGSLYNLDTKNQNTYVSVITWQPYIKDEIANKVLTEGGSSYKLADTVAPHEDLAKSAEKALDNWRVVQYVEKNTKATNAFGGLKVTGGGQSLSALGLPNKSSTEDKYYMKPAGQGEIAGQGDLDIIGVTTIEIHYEIKADVEGNITFYRKRDGSDWVEIGRLNKTQGIDALNPEIKALNDRTQIVTNLLTVLTRNAGNDTSASWAPDGKWYNEAFDGICYVRRETSFEVGFLDSPIRSAAIDPNLTPVNKGQSDLFSTAFLSQFRMNDKSDAYTGEVAGYVGKFKGQNVILNGAENMFKTRVFSIPNVNVQDIKGN